MSRILRHQVGDIEVIALTDGTHQFDNETFPDTDPAEIANLVAAAGHDAIITCFNCFLIRTRDHLTLVDTGMRDLAGSKAGYLPDALAEAGVANGDITRLFFTHLHPDHVAGAVTTAGKMVFENAEVQVNADELAFWVDDGNFTNASENNKQNQQLAKIVVQAYRNQTSTFTGAADLGGGVSALPLYGHTVGHSGLRVASGTAQFIMAGDIVHAQSLQLANPDIGVVFDTDGGAAEKTRRNLLDMLATDEITFSGGHFLQPAIGRAVRAGSGYAFRPLD